MWKYCNRSCLPVLAGLLLLSGCGSLGTSAKVAPAAEPQQVTEAQPRKTKRARRKARRAEQKAMEAGAAAPAPEEALAQYGQIVELMEQGMHTEAELALLKFVLAYPEYAAPYVNLGILYMGSDRLEAAERAFEDAVALNPASAAAHNQLGILHRQAGRFPEADQAYQRALEADPDYANAHFNRGLLYDLYLQQTSVALPHYERYFELIGGSDSQVEKWIAELKLRIASEQRTAQVGEQ